MAAIEKFEDIRAWQKARELTNAVYEVSRSQDFARDFRLRDQICAAATSVMANIAEGFDADSGGDFIRFLGYARRSATEVQSHSYVALDQKYITDEQFNHIYELAHESKSLIGGFVRYLRANKR